MIDGAVKMRAASVAKFPARRAIGRGQDERDPENDRSVETELMEDALHGDVHGMVMRIDRF